MTLSAPAIAQRKRRDGAEPLVMVTAYDEPGARYADAAGVDLLLVGDSLANVVLGHRDTLRVTIDVMCHHVAAVAAARPTAHIVADLPWLSFHLDRADTERNAAALIRAGAQSVKLEGGRVRGEMIAALLDAEIPVMGHLGLTPQSLLVMGGYKVQGKSAEAQQQLVEDAAFLDGAGVYAMVVEGVPASLGAQITDAVRVPTIGIGAGPATDGQVLVFHDLLGLTASTPPKFVRRYAELGGAITDAIGRFCADVRDGSFPAEAESYPG